MTLTARVIGIDVGEVFTDGEPRVRLRIMEADKQFNEIRLPMFGSLGLGDEVLFMAEVVNRAVETDDMRV